MTTLKQLEVGLVKYLNKHLKDIRSGYWDAGHYALEFMHLNLELSAKQLAPIFASDPETLCEYDLETSSRWSNQSSNDPSGMPLTILDGLVGVIQSHLMHKAMEWENKVFP